MMASMDRAVLRSGDLELDLGVHQVRKAGRVVDVAPRSFDLLRCLMSRAPATVSREELLREVWHDVHVCESAIAQAIRSLRVAVDAGDSPPRVLTVRGRGYRFDGLVVAAGVYATVVRAAAPTTAAARSNVGEVPARRTVLIVDDEQDIVDALGRTLRGLGCRFLGATSGREALRILDQETVDLIVSDIDMPLMSGLDLIARVRVSHPHVVRVVLTGVASLDTALRAINDGEVHRFLTKPWNKDELRQVIGASLARTGARGAHETAADAAGNAAGNANRRGLEAGFDELSRPLSPRLRQTLVELMTGAREKEIAGHLGVSPHTAHQYVKTLYRRFDVASRAELMVKLGPGRGAPVEADLALRGTAP
jgi:DNA-binding response OmpR family regulator